MFTKRLHEAICHICLCKLGLLLSSCVIMSCAEHNIAGTQRRIPICLFGIENNIRLQSKITSNFFSCSTNCIDMKISAQCICDLQLVTSCLRSNVPPQIFITANFAPNKLRDDYSLSVACLN